MNEETKIWLHRIICTLFLSLSIFIDIRFFLEIDTFIIIFFPLFSLVLFLNSLTLSFKCFRYQDKIISVYAGFIHHTLRINSEIYDEQTTLITFTPIKLSTKLENNIEINATISTLNRISIKINNKLIK